MNSGMSSSQYTRISYGRMDLFGFYISLSFLSDFSFVSVFFIGFVCTNDMALNWHSTTIHYSLLLLMHRRTLLRAHKNCVNRRYVMRNPLVYISIHLFSEEIIAFEIFTLNTAVKRRLSHSKEHGMRRRTVDSGWWTSSIHCTNELTVEKCTETYRNMFHKILIQLLANLLHII